jgi:hypothetical protein
MNEACKGGTHRVAIRWRVQGGGGVLASEEVGVDRAGGEVNGASEVRRRWWSSDYQGCLETYARGGFLRRAHAVIRGWELRNCEEGGKRVAHEAAPGAEVVICKEGRMLISEKDLFVGFREVGRERHGGRRVAYIVWLVRIVRVGRVYVWSGWRVLAAHD